MERGVRLTRDESRAFTRTSQSASIIAAVNVFSEFSLPPMHSTIKDVAAHSGVSIATVSRALNAPQLLNAETLAKVRESIEALDFMPSARGRQLRGVRTRLVGVVVPTLANPVFAESLQGIDEAASASDYRLMLMTTAYDSARERRAIETLREQRVDGLIATVADAESKPLLDDLDRIGLPYVLAHNDTAYRAAVSVHPDAGGFVRGIGPRTLAVSRLRRRDA